MFNPTNPSLMLPESLNNDFDKQDSVLLHDQEIVLYQNIWQTAHSFPHLHIMNETIIQQTQYQLHATNLAY